MTLFVFNLKYWKPKVWNALSALYLVTILQAFWDIVWALVDGRPKLIWLGHIADIVHIGCIGFAGFLWFCYCTRGDAFRIRKDRKAYFLYMIPLLIVTVLILSSPFTGWAYYIDEFGVYHRGPLFYLHCIVGLAYMVAASVLSLLCAKRAEYERDRRGFIALASFSLPPVVLNILQYSLPRGGLVVAPYAILLSLLILFVNDQHQKILVDNLTGLPNRYGLDVSLHERLLQSKKDGKDKFSVILGDLDNFKQVNDTWGHPEGDRALCLTAAVLQKVANQYGATAYRMGGDEFIIITDNGTPETAELIYGKIEELLKGVRFRDDFVLAMSMGIVAYDGIMSASDLLNAVDRKLYDKKRKKGFSQI